MIALVAIADRADGLPEGLRAVDVGGVAGLYAPAPLPEPEPDALWEHATLLDGLMGDRTILPVRWGTTLPDEEALRTLLSAQHDAFARLLRRVAGCVELRVRATLAEERPGEAKAWLAARAARGHRAAALHEALAQLAVDARERPSRDGLHAAYLVPESAVDRFTARLHELAGDVPVSCTGPWPAFSFVEAVA